MTRLVPELDEATFAALKTLIVAETGQHYYEDKQPQLREKIVKRMMALGLSDGHLYFERLQDASAGPREWRQLESELTIKETFFFRFAEQFAALRENILPGLIAAHAEDRHLRIWSAGCSTGAEPYSLAVLIHDLLGEAYDDWHVSILGTDIDEAALGQARTARYGGWALRTVGPDERGRLFDREEDAWRLKTPYRGMVRFERQNLLDLLDPAGPIGRDGYDLILCRNLLIYFRLDVATALVSAMGERLAPQGLLLLGHAEAGVAVESGLAAREIGGALVYVRPSPAETNPAPVPAVAPRQSTRGAESALRKRPAPRRQPASAAKSPQPPGEPAGDLAEVRALLAKGETKAARALIGQVKATRTRDPLLLYLDGLGAAAEQDGAAAEKALRGALYLDRDFAMAHYLLGQQLIAVGRTGEGRRALANAADALARESDDAPVPEGEGLSVADLREAIRHRLDAREASR